MINLGITDFYIGIPSLPRHEFEKYSTQLFDEWETYVEKSLKIQDYYLALHIEEGSIKGAGKIAAALSVIYIGIAQYGSFVSGVQTIQGQISAIENFLAKRATTPFPTNKTKPKIKKYEGSLYRLQKLFTKVQQGKITTEQAMVQAEFIFDNDAQTTPELTQKLKTSFDEIPTQGQQLTLPLSSYQKEFIIPKTDKIQPPCAPRPKPEQPINQQFRIEVWRESKKYQRKVCITQL
ncbi:hypothetical protein [Pseudomonas sp. ADAK13]|uniref:hypothetical protein n=1 Tax=Pseudomonas sp. ADAK13 TaxID=2730847 RepID=UPI0014631FB3|nr:hypothetical protein [Pseudomonas sp. ADAK13]QJI36699.1 hypothetical protein HKK54_20430 [Pseudomonas sp. ADAK13]